MDTATVMGMGHKKLNKLLDSTLIGSVSLLLCAPAAFCGQWTVSPSMRVEEIATDNIALSSREKASELVSDLNPGIKIHGFGDRIQLDLDYQLHQLLYANNSYHSHTQNYLKASGLLEAVDNHLFLDVSASMQQQTISPFLGANSGAGNAYSLSNSVEQRSFQLSPYWKGVLGQSVEYKLGYEYRAVNNSSASALDVNARDWLLNMKGGAGQSSFAWTLDGTTKDTEYGDGRSYSEDTLRGVLAYHLSNQFNVLGIAGAERNNYLSDIEETKAIRGVGFEWLPGARTKLSVTRERRFFGNANRIDFTHRTAGTSWQYFESETATPLGEQSTTLGLGTYYNLFYNLFATAIPDPVQRAAFVTAYLAASGVSPNAQLQGGYLSSGVAKQHQRQLSFAINGVRNTVALSATRTQTENLSSSIGSGFLVGEDLNVYQSIRQTGATLSWSHQLSPLASVVTAVARLRSSGAGSSSLQTNQTAYSLNLQTKLGAKTNLGVGARHVVVDGTSNYTENALTGAISHQF